MSQDYDANTYQGDHAGVDDLQQIENNFAALKSNFSHTSQPSNAEKGQDWYDTTKKVRKTMNEAESAWLGLMSGDVSQLMIVYRNAAGEGWAVDGSVTDRLIALKGGSTYVTGGASAGSWTISGLTKDAHVHGMNSHIHTLETFGTSSSRAFANHVGWESGGRVLSQYGTGGATTINRPAPDTEGPSEANTEAQSDAAVTHAPGWRALAAVVTMQRMDI